jgi:hypothetical protein
VAPPLENPSSDLSEMNIRSAPCNRVDLPNFIPVGRGFRYDKLPTKIELKKRHQKQNGRDAILVYDTYGGHIGALTTKQHIRYSFFWPTLARDTKA